MRARALVAAVAVGCFALAGGMALGTGALRGDNERRLQSEVDQLRQQTESMRGAAATVKRADTYRDAFATKISNDLVHGRLAGRTVVLVTLPGAEPRTTRGLDKVLTAAGASITGTVRIADKWDNPRQREFLEDLTSRLVTSDVSLPAQGTAYDRSGMLLARAIVQDGAGAAGHSDSQAAMILQGYQAGGLLEVDGTPQRADLAVVVAPPTGRGHDGSTEGDASLAAVSRTGGAWVALAAALDRASHGVVVAGDAGSAADGVIATLRSDPDVSADVSSVDVADLPSGRVGTVWALAEQDDGGSGQYGAFGATDGALPEPVGSG